MNPQITPRERVWQAVRHIQPDRTPYHISFTKPVCEKLERHYGTTDLDQVLDNHIVRHKARPLETEESPGMWRDDFGILWNRTVDKDIGVVEEYLLKGRSLKGFTFPDPHDPIRYAGFPKFMADNPGRFRLVSIGKTLFERAWMLRGMQELMVDMLEAPAFVEELLDAMTDFNLEVVAGVMHYDIDGVIFGDDWGQQNGLLFSPRLWRKMILPRIRQMYAAVHTAGKAVFIHSCGKVQSLFPDLIEAGVDVFNPFQPDVMDPYEMKRQFGAQLAFYGGMSVQRVLPYGTPQDVREEALRLMEIVGRGGGFVIAPSHDMPADIPLENIIAFVETVKNGR